MLKNRLFFVLIAACLLVVAALLVFQASAIAQSNSTAQYQSTPNGGCPFSAGEIRSIHGVFVKEIGIWLPYTDHGPTGVDGGVLELMKCPAMGK